jgi:hypothetical protein
MLAHLTAPIADHGDRFTRDLLLFSAALVVAGLAYATWEMRPGHLRVEIQVAGQRGAESWIEASLDGGHAGRAYDTSRSCRLSDGRCGVTFSWPRGRHASRLPGGPAPTTLSLALHNGQDVLPLGGATVRAPSGAPVRLACRYGGGCVGTQ